jgi:hypothetical protein
MSIDSAAGPRVNSSGIALGVMRMDEVAVVSRAISDAGPWRRPSKEHPRLSARVQGSSSAVATTLGLAVLILLNSNYGFSAVPDRG